MPSVPAVSSGEFLDKVVAAPSSRESASSGGAESFDHALADANQELGSGGQTPAASSAQAVKGRDPRNDAVPAKSEGPEQASSKREDASADSSPADGKDPAPAAVSEGKPQASGKQPGKGEEADPSSSDDGEPPQGQEQATLIVFQLIAAGVYGLSPLTGGAPVEPVDGNGLKPGALALSPAAGEGKAGQPQADSGAALLLPADGPLQGVPAGSQAPTAQTEAATALPAGAVPPEGAGEVALTAGQTDAPEETPPPSSFSQAAASPEAEVLPSAADDGAVQAAAHPVPDDAPAADDTARAAAPRESESAFAGPAPDETAEAEEAPARPAAASLGEAEAPEEGARQAGRILRADEGSAEAPERSSQPIAPVPVAGAEGDFGQPAEGDDPKGHLLAAKQVVGQASSDVPSKAAPPAAPASQPMDALLRAEVQRQVMEAALTRMNLAVRDGVAHARLQLDPPSLGRLHMELRMEDGALNAKVTVETAWAKDTVMSGLRELKESLQRQGVTLERFSVDVQAGLTAGNFGQNRAGSGGEDALYLEAVPEEEAAVLSVDRAPAYAAPSPAGERSINIFA